VDYATRERRLAGLAVLAGPLVFLLGFSVAYVLLPWACAAHQLLVLHGVTLVTLLLVLGSGLLAWNDWRALPKEAGSRSRFMAVLGMSASGLFILVILAQWIPQFMLHPCTH
jgi:hypothetical protein